MTTFLQFAVLGIGLGAAYSLLASGLVLVQTGSGVINFAHGAMAMCGAFIFYTLRETNGWAVAPALVVAVLVIALLGVAVFLFLMRPLRGSSALASVIATLGVLLTLQALGVLFWGADARITVPVLPSESVSLGGVAIGTEKLAMLGIAAFTTLALWALYRFTPLGLGIRAAAENERAAATLGWSSTLLGSFTWALGGALAALAGVLISTQTGLQVDDMTLIVIPALAAALCGGFTSFPQAFAGAMLIGIGQSLATKYLPTVVGVATALPFAVIVVLLVIRGKSLPVRGATSTANLPDLGSGILRWKLLLPALAIFILLIVFVFPTRLMDGLTVSLGWGIILLSVVVLMGYAGQVDLAPLAWGGLGALIASRLVADLSVPFELAILIGVAGAIPIGVLFGIPALRARGLNLAVVTLGLGVMVHAMVFGNMSITGAYAGSGLNVGSQTFFGINIDAYAHPERYLLLVLIVFVLLSITVANLRRGRVGRRLIAVRTNERAAAALGISVFGTKLYAFAFSATLAAVGGILLGFHYNNVLVYDNYGPVDSMLAAVHAVVGGVGFVLGPLVAAPMAVGGLGTWIQQELVFNAKGVYLSLLAGVLVLVILLGDRNGLIGLKLRTANAQARGGRWLVTKTGNAMRRGNEPRPVQPKPAPEPEPLPDIAPDAISFTPMTLEVAELTVRYGGVTAVDGVSLTVRPGEVVGLIGPNGAGKTTVIDAITGFVKPAAGSVRLNGEAIDGLPVHRRVHAGVCRSFQNLELFESGTVRENLRVAADPRDRRAGLVDLVRVDKTPLSPLAVLAIREFGLEEVLDVRVSELSYGLRRLTGIARTVAAGPSVLLLDEPAAGLSVPDTRELVRIVRRFADTCGIGVLVVEHDMSFVMDLCDQIVVVDFGRPLAVGTPDAIRSDPAVVAAYLGEPYEPDAAVAQERVQA